MQRHQGLWYAIKPWIDVIVAGLGALLISKEVVQGLFWSKIEQSVVSYINFLMFLTISAVVIYVAVGISRHLSQLEFIKQIVIGLLVVNVTGILYFLYTRLLLEGGIEQFGGASDFVIGVVIRLAALFASYNSLRYQLRNKLHAW